MSNRAMIGGTVSKIPSLCGRLTVVLCAALSITFLSATKSVAVQPPQGHLSMRKPILLPPSDGPAMLDFGANAVPFTAVVPALTDTTPKETFTPSSQGSVGIGTLRRPKALHGDGYTQDSASQQDQRSKGFSLPGISLKVPLY